MNIVVLFTFFLSFHYSSYAQQNEKRILVNDQDVAERISHMEQTLMQYKSDILHLQQMIQELVSRQQSDSLQIQQLLVENKQKSQMIEQLESSIMNTGSMYVRWGKAQCPNNTVELVYSGYAGGGLYNQTGSSAEHVCLPPDPNFVKTDVLDNGRMFGAEYESNFWAFDSHNQDVPCSLCRKPNSSTTVMIPGKSECYKGWNREYYGYLASGNVDYASASSYICVDINPDYVPSGLDDKNGKLLYSVVAKCGSLPCPPYLNNYPLTCVVCSK